MHPALLVHTRVLDSGRAVVAQTSESDPPLILRDSRVAWALSLLPDEFSRAEAMVAWEQHEELLGIASELWTLGVSENLLIPSGSVRSRVRRWDWYNWHEASAYQEATRDYPFLRMDLPDAFVQDDRRMEEYVARTPVPPIYMQVEAMSSVPLPRLRVGESADALVAALSKEERRGLEGLGLLFDICFGERARRPFGVQGHFLRKSIPSGGARHPTEIFFASFAGSPVSLGVYHYNVEHHRLDAISLGDTSGAFEHTTFDLFKKYVVTPIGLLVFTSHWERAMWRYRDARSWRAPLIDVGHALMAYRTLCQQLGFGYYTYQKFRDRELCRLIGRDPVQTTPLFVGTLV